MVCNFDIPVWFYLVLWEKRDPEKLIKVIFILAGNHKGNKKIYIILKIPIFMNIVLYF